MTTIEEALGVFIGGSGIAGIVAAVIVYMVKGTLATAVQQAGAREMERLKSDLARGLEKERQEAATTLEGFKAQLTLAAEVRRQVAAKKVDAIERLSNAANLLTTTILDIVGRGPDGEMRGICPNILDYTHLIQATRNYYSTEFYDALQAFYACAQQAYMHLASLPDEQRHEAPSLHAQVEAGRARLSEAMRAELYGPPSDGQATSG